MWGEFVFYLGTCTSTAGTSSCVGTGQGLLQVDYQPMVGRENGGSVFNKRASEQFLPSDCCCRIPPSVAVVAG